MNIIFTVVAGPLIGYFVRSRPLAAAIYLAAGSLVFAYQSMAVLLAWMAGEGGFGGASEQGAFGPPPTGFPITYSESDFWSYGLVNLAITAVGLALVLVANSLRSRRAAKRRVLAAG